jgi:heme oxygenase
MTGDRRWLLRERTAEAHAAVDAAIGSFSDRESYERYLQQIYAFRMPIERALDALVWPSRLGSWRAKAVGELIEADLGDLGLELPVIDVTGLDLDGDALLGVLYVLEGSSLGSRLLYRRAEALGFSASFGARHLAHASGPESWRDFLGLLETQHDLDLEEATAASLATFRAAQAAFAPPV